MTYGMKYQNRKTTIHPQKGGGHFKPQENSQTSTNGGRHFKPQENNQTLINGGRHFKPQDPDPHDSTKIAHITRGETLQTPTF